MSLGWWVFQSSPPLVSNSRLPAGLVSFPHLLVLRPVLQPPSLCQANVEYPARAWKGELAPSTVSERGLCHAELSLEGVSSSLSFSLPPTPQRTRCPRLWALSSLVRPRWTTAQISLLLLFCPVGTCQDFVGISCHISSHSLWLSILLFHHPFHCCFSEVSEELR